MVDNSSKILIKNIQNKVSVQPMEMIHPGIISYFLLCVGKDKICITTN